MAMLSRTLTTDEFQALDWLSIIQGTQWDHDRWIAAQRLYEKAHELTEQGQRVPGEALFLIGGVISMQLRHGGPHPYGPMLQRRGQGRSLSLEDMEAIDADFLGQVAREIVDPWLQARFADVAVSIGRSSGVDWQLGKLCVEAQLAYLRTVFLTDRAIDGVDDCRRALKLLWVYAKRDEALRDAYWDLIKEQVGHSLENNWPGVAFPLCDEAMQRSESACEALAPLIQAKADAYVHESPVEAARYYDYASRLWRRLGKTQKSREAKLAQGESFVRAAELATQVNPLIAPHWMTEGIAVLRRARAPAERIRELRDLLLAYQLASLDSFQSRKYSVDVSDWIEHIEAVMIGPTFFEALLQMTFQLSRWVDFDQCRREAIESSERYVFSSLFAAQHANDEGAIVATEEAFDRANEDSVFQRMVKHLVETHLNPRAKVLVTCAADILYSNYQVQFSAVKEIVDASPMTPEDRSETLARGLYAGICDDWIAAAAYLIPSVEPMMRTILRRRGIHTANLLQGGVQQEKTLSELLDMPVASQILGAGLQLELKAILTEPLGINLRNMYCHGLLRDHQLQNVGTMCLWWTLWRLILLPWADCTVEVASTEDDAVESMSTPGSEIEMPSS